MKREREKTPLQFLDIINTDLSKSIMRKGISVIKEFLRESVSESILENGLRNPLGNILFKESLIQNARCR
jgi:hypothetical protein